MRRIAATSAAIALLLTIIGAASIVSATPKPTAATTSAKTLQFDVRFSDPFFLDLGEQGPSLGDQTIFHDQLLSNGKQVGEDGGTCTIVDAAQPLLNCTVSFRLPGGQLTAQGLNTPDPTKRLAITGGTDIYRSVRGQATLVEFGDGTGSVTFQLLP